MKYPEDFKEDVREMLADGLTMTNVAWYLGVSVSVVYSIKNPEKVRASNVKYYTKNYSKMRAYQKEYSKKWYAAKKEKEAQKIEEIRARWKQEGL